jgi:hypothetical protein
MLHLSANRLGWFEGWATVGEGPAIPGVLAGRGAYDAPSLCCNECHPEGTKNTSKGHENTIEVPLMHPKCTLFNRSQVFAKC